MKKTKNDIYVENCLELFQAFADKTRQEIIMIFVNCIDGCKEMCANDIANKFSLSRPTISHHLNLMKRSNILIARKEGKEIYYSLNKSYIKELLSSILVQIESCC
jgi:DNA-binding transcriptional ArsR family regulator